MICAPVCPNLDNDHRPLLDLYAKADDMRSRVEELTENGTKNLYIIVNYSGLYRTNRMLKELAQNTKEQKGEQA